jgi:serine/threonine protein kinase
MTTIVAVTPVRHVTATVRHTARGLLDFQMNLPGAMIDRTIGPYEVLSKLGEGGMGEVYRARDTRLLRDVAIRVPPEAFASDRDRLARFER